MDIIRLASAAFLLACAASIPANAAPAVQLAQEAPAAQPAKAGPTKEVAVSDLVGLDVVNAEGEVIGTVDRLVQEIADEKLFAIISHGGLLGFEKSQFKLPVENLLMTAGRLQVVGATDAQVQALPEWRSDNPAFRGYFGTAPIQQAGSM
jgi:sporulation protein YlmC with PRC-barrel domain